VRQSLGMFAAICSEESNGRDCVAAILVLAYALISSPAFAQTCCPAGCAPEANRCVTTGALWTKCIPIACAEGSRRPSAGSSGPTREHRKNAVVAHPLRTVPQSQVPAARAGNEAAAPPKTPDAETLAALMTRAKSLLTLGDIAAARLLLERAANAQDATAAFLLAQTYDPAVLGVRDTRSITPDPVMARDWYRKAASLGSADAQQRLTQLPN
jgi:hypothetical protein